MDSQLTKVILCRYFHQLLNEKDISVCEELHVDRVAEPNKVAARILWQAHSLTQLFPFSRWES